MMREMIAAFDLVDADDGVRAVIVTGSGRGVLRRGRPVERWRHIRQGRRPTSRRRSACHVTAVVMTTLRIFECTKPVIGAINGAAVGVGVTMTLPMDIRLASTTARFGFVFARRGIVPEAASSYFLPRIVGISRAAEWCYTGRVFSAEEALDGRSRAERARTRRSRAGGQGAGGRDRRQRGSGLGGADPPDAVADARRRSSDGGAPCRQPGDPASGARAGTPARGSRASSRSGPPSSPTG